MRLTLLDRQLSGLIRRFRRSARLVILFAGTNRQVISSRDLIARGCAAGAAGSGSSLFNELIINAELLCGFGLFAETALEIPSLLTDDAGACVCVFVKVRSEIILRLGEPAFSWVNIQRCYLRSNIRLRGKRCSTVLLKKRWEIRKRD